MFLFNLYTFHGYNHIENLAQAYFFKTKKNTGMHLNGQVAGLKKNLCKIFNELLVLAKFKSKKIFLNLKLLILMTSRQLAITINIVF